MIGIGGKNQGQRSTLPQSKHEELDLMNLDEPLAVM